jgi:RNA polymerase sigma-70 factor (ECF subfamily)
VLQPNRPDELLPTRQSLLGRLKDWQDDKSWSLFFDTYWKWIYYRATRAGLTDAEAQDVVQETLLSVSKSMKSFDYRQVNGSFKSWLQKLTTWKIADQIKKRQKHIAEEPGSPDRDTETEIIGRVPGPPDDSIDEDWERNLLEAALNRIKNKVDPAHFQVYELHVFQKWPVAKAAAAIKATSAHVYLIKHRINKLLKKEIEHLQKKII